MSRIDGLMTIDEIKAAMKAKGMTQIQLANAMGLNNPNKISLSLAGKRQIKAREMEQIKAILAPAATAETAGSPTRRIPVIGYVAAGNWREAIQQSMQSLPVPEDTPPNAVALRIVGDSMNKFVQDGADVIFDPDDRSLFPGRLYVVLNAEGEATFKQFLADPARFEPCSTNPKHKPIIIGDDSFQIVGRVIGAFNRY